MVFDAGDGSSNESGGGAAGDRDRGSPAGAGACSFAVITIQKVVIFPDTI